MTTAASASSPTDFWNLDFTVPQPTQDADLLKNLNFVPGLKEILMLRQVHALEHATVWVLSNSVKTQFASAPKTVDNQNDNDLLGGLSTDQGFYLYGEVKLGELRRATRIALQRITSGEWNLAVHPRCGTNLSVEMLVMAGLALGIHLILPRSPIEQILGLGVAVGTATQLAPDLGSLAQRYLTTAIPFNLEIEDISTTYDIWGRSAQFVKVRWRDH